MNEDLPFDESTLSADDLAALRAFDAIESWDTFPSSTDTPSSTRGSNTTNTTNTLEFDDMLPTFLTEVEEDIGGMLQILQRLEREDSARPSHFVALQRLGHKMRGTAGAMGYLKMSEIASHIEIIAEQVIYHMLQPTIGGKAISHAVTILEFCLYRLVQDSQEPADAILIANLQSFYATLSIDLDQPIQEDLPPLPLPAQSARETSSESTPLSQSAAETPAPYTLASPPVAEGILAQTTDTGTRPFDNLLHHSEKLLAQHASIEHAYKQVDTAFQDLQVAQARFQHLETLLSTSLAQERLPQLPEDLTSSSLITRIFNTAASRENSRLRRGRTSKAPSPYQQLSTWDELDIEHYSPKDILLRSLREAMANIDACSTRLKSAYHTMHKLQQEYMTNVNVVREDALSMRLLPLTTVVPPLRDIVMASMLAKEGQVDFEVSGDQIEVDQEVLSSLSPLLAHLLQTCIDTATTSKGKLPALSQAGHIWLHAHVINNEVFLEVGFSMPVRGGVLQMLREQLRLLNGSISLERNVVGGISFLLRFPRIRGLLRCLLVRVADQQLLIPLSQVQSVSHTIPANATQAKQIGSSYHLGSLLDMPMIHTSQATQATRMQQVVFMQLPVVYTQREPLKVLVDEIVDEIELMVRPFPSHLRRPGIVSSTIDGQGNVLPLLDIAELVGNYTQKAASHKSKAQNITTQPLKILVADDSASFRGSILQTLQRTTYQVSEARDGLEALESLKLDTPDIILLDIEMPYLNGYDLLDILRQNSQFSTIKVIMLTSRTSDKHLQHALELGAHAYLTKPSPPEKLLTTIQEFSPLTKMARS